MGANDLQQSLLQAMDLLSSKAANNTNAAITIKGEIVEQLDTTARQYSVSYGGAIYKDVYAMSDASYSKSTIVWILIPDGNFDNPKIILGAVSPKVTEYVTETETDMYVPISSNLFGAESSINLRSWVNESKNVSISTSNFGIVFKDYLDTYKNFVFTAYIKTNIDKDHQSKGNYGLILYLPFLVQDQAGTTSQIWKSYVMDVSTMQGNPYAFNEYQKVDLYYEVDDSLTYDINRTPYIQAFTQDFGYTTTRADIQYDIFIKNIAMKMVDVLSETDTTGYYLAVVASEGNYFLNGKYVNSKTLTPVLKVNAKTSDVTKWDCYWFVEDSSIDITSENYHTLGGLGWKCLNKKVNVTYDNEGNKTFQYVTNQYNYTVKDTDVISALRYKCVLTKDEIVVGGSTRLRNLNANITTALISATGSNSFIEGVGNVVLIARIYYPGVTDVTKPSINLSTSWQRFNKDGDYIDSNFYSINRYNDRAGNYFETEISYPCTLLEKLNTINCTFYSTTINNGTTVQNNLGTASIVVTTSSDFTYGLNIIGGDVLYKYDSDGDSPMVANYDGPASSKIKTIDPITFKIFKPDGSELSDLEYNYARYKWSFPKNSMMKLVGTSTSEGNDYYYISGYGKSSINYTILGTYNKKKTNNSILLEINFDNITLNDSINPKFLKDGEGGTNGSKYSAVLTYLDYAYGERDGNGKIRKLQAIFIAGTGWRLLDVENGTLVNFNSPKLVANIYKDGAKISSGYNVSWSMFDSTITKPFFGVNGGTLNILGDWSDASLDEDKIHCSIVECAITIDELSETNSKEVVYAYYPIEITRLVNSSLINKGIPTLDGGFEEVVYASDGTNPQYDNTNPFQCTNNLYNDDNGDFYDYSWIGSKNLRVPSGIGQTSAIKPVTKFDNGYTKNYVAVTLTMSAAKRTAIQNKINTLATEITNTQNLINFYLHNKQHILDFAQNFSYNNYEGHLNSAKTLLGYRFSMLDVIPSLRAVLEEINTYCIEHTINPSYFNYTRYYNSYSSALDSAYKILYLLGNTRTLDDVSDMAGNLIVVPETDVTSHYGIAVYTQLHMLAESWNDLIINKYEVDYAKLIAKSSNQYVLLAEYNALHNFDTGIIALPQNTDLSYLVTVHDGNDPTQEFINLKTELIGYANKLSNEKDSLLSYSSLVEDLLKPIQKLLEIYQNTTYQEKYYANIDSQLQATLIDLQNQKAGYEATLLPANANYIIHIKPIVMVFNRYELSHINGWDGSKLYVDSNNDQYLLAPQVGAGAKKNGLFTGVIMGVKQFNQSTTQHIGLFGYSSGVQSYFMNAEDGSVIMGKSGAGQMIADPTVSAALLYSYNYWKSTAYGTDGKPTSYGANQQNGQGMLINLTDAYVHLGSAADGKIYSGEHSTLGSTANGFFLNQNGLSIGTGFTISTEGISEIIHESSNIGQWRIKTVTVKDESGNDKTEQCIVSKVDGSGGIFLDAPSSTIVLGNSDGRIYSGQHYGLDRDTEGFYLSNKGLSIGKYFTVLSSGQATVTHENSTVGQWKLTGDGDNQKLASRNNGILLDAPNSRIILGGSLGEIYSGLHTSLNSTANGFYLSDDGLSIHSTIRITSNDPNLGPMIEIGRVNGTRKWIISGNSDQSFIGWNATTFNTNSNSVYIGTNGISLGHDKFWVTNSGELMSKSGHIGGWEITNNTLQANGITINSNGNIKGNNWEITSGNATFNDLTANGTGEIAGWKINDWGLQSPSNSMMIKSEGSMYGPGNNWYITSAGDAKFDNITCTSVWTFGSGNATWSSLNGFSFGNGISGLGGLLFTPNAFDFGAGTITLGSEPSKNADGIRVSSNGDVKISGDIYARNGYFSGEIQSSSGKIGGWTIGSDSLYSGSGISLKADGNIIVSSVKVFGTASNIQWSTQSSAGDTDLGTELTHIWAAIGNKADPGDIPTYALGPNGVHYPLY